MITLYTSPTPNGWKASIALEELGLDYEVKAIDLAKGDQKKPGFLKLTPPGRIPAIVDHDEGDLAVFESGAILIYLAEKTGKLMPTDVAGRSRVIQWLMFQMGGVGPMFGQLGHFFKYAKDKCDHPYPVERYTNEAKRLLGVLDKRLEGRDYIVDEYSIADIAIFPWVNCLEEFYGAVEQVDLKSYGNVEAWRARCNARPATIKGRALFG